MVVDVRAAVVWVAALAGDSFVTGAQRREPATPAFGAGHRLRRLSTVSIVCSILSAGNYLCDRRCAGSVCACLGADVGALDRIFLWIANVARIRFHDF